MRYLFFLVLSACGWGPYDFQNKGNLKVYLPSGEELGCNGFDIYHPGTKQTINMRCVSKDGVIIDMNGVENFDMNIHILKRDYK